VEVSSVSPLRIRLFAELEDSLGKIILAALQSIGAPLKVPS